MPYYGLYIPVKGGGATAASGGTDANASSSGAAANGNGIGNASSKDNKTEFPCVFRTKIDAFKILKQHKDARLKEFCDEEDAIKYAQTGFEVVQNKYNDVKSSTASLEKAAFRAPTKQELVKFRNIIESGDCEHVKQIIWDNPRYLVSSGDTPTTLKEGYRYNAMHVCAISQRPQVAELILKTVSDPKFVDLLTGKKNDEKMCQELCVNLLDYYLNIPEKGRSETPLHFASKLGCPEMVEVLISYSECKMTPNNEGLLPKEIICSRAPYASTIVRQKIKNLFEERYFVPVLRCNDSSVPAQIGQPFPANNPPNLNCDPLSPEVEIKALAGPMSKDQAKKFFRRWKTPPRLGSNVSSPIANNPFISPMKSRKSLPVTPRSGAPPTSSTSFNSPTAMLQRRSLFNSTPQSKDRNDVNGFDQSLILDESFDTDHQNGNHDKENINSDSFNKPETNNNNNHQGMGNKLKPGMCPSTPLFKIKKEAFFTYREQIMASPMVGSIEVQDEHELFNCSDIYDSPGFKERHLKNTDTEKGIECIGRNLAKEQNVEWREYWDFLSEFIDISSEKGMQKLECYLGQKQRELEIKQQKKVKSNSGMLEEVCSALEKMRFPSDSSAPNHGRENQTTENGFRSAASNANVSTGHQSSTPYTYVEKSLQVHARRMTKTIVHNIDNLVSINDALLLELRRVKSLIYSFKEDESFLNVNFEKVHSRIGNLVSMFLVNSQEITMEMKEKISTILENLFLTPGERREHIECVCSVILSRFKHPVEQIQPECLKTEEMCTKIWSLEKDCDCQWESNLSRKTSRRNRMEALYKSHQRMKQQEKTIKQQETNTNLGSTTDYRNPKQVNDSSDDAEDDVFWSDFGGSDSEADDVWLTPPESPSRLSLAEEEAEEHDGYKIFIYGNEPTKRDLDVLNAIFHVDVDKTKHPTIHSWKTALLRYSNEEMDFFPSPRVVKKSQNITNSSCRDAMPQTPPSQHKPRQLLRSNTASMLQTTGSPRQSMPLSSTLPAGFMREPILQQLPTVKRLFMSPGRPKSMTAMPSTNNETTTTPTLSSPSSTTTTTKETAEEVAVKLPAAVNVNIANLKMNQRPLTPLNKLRGLFSSYRERLDNSPLPTTFNDHSSNEGSNSSYSLLNISASD